MSSTGTLEVLSTRLRMDAIPNTGAFCYLETTVGDFSSFRILFQFVRICS